MSSLEAVAEAIYRADTGMVVPRFAGAPVDLRDRYLRLADAALRRVREQPEGLPSVRAEIDEFAHPGEPRAQERRDLQGGPIRHSGGFQPQGHGGPPTTPPPKPNDLGREQPAGLRPDDAQRLLDYLNRSEQEDGPSIAQLQPQIDKLVSLAAAPSEGGPLSPGGET